MAHGEIKMLCVASDLAENAPVISQLSFGGAKARTAALHLDILLPVVRRFRTTHRKLSLSDFTVCAFAPLEKEPQ